ncbi:sulfatase-like hydrolase/transferase [Halovivax gelatinilyticus]|uniref:sulfatase-like hydrolase/transferase n=1 Tax=Halovivax gelatinilyticus TaxID=2961597 RepID=UPI0020CA7C89|nr:sulfatase-like hydrolase/transferase [Halovivax gelatinilyticus]
MSERDPNVFVLTVDSLRWDAYDRLMSEVGEVVPGTTFTRAFATASNTGSSMPTLAAGVYCDEVADGTPNLDLGETSEDDGLTTLAEALSAAGYDASLWSDNVIFGEARNYDRGFSDGRTGTPSWKKRAQTVVQGTGSARLFNACRWAYFNVFDRIESTLSSNSSYYVPAKTHHQSVLDALSGTDGGQAHWIHYMDVHHPFEPPAEYLAKRDLNAPRRPAELAELSSSAIIQNAGGETTHGDVEDIEQAYLAACEHLRDELVSFVETLRDRGHYDPGHDVLVLTADHGEGFDRDLHGMLGHTPTPAFWDDLVHVPLLVSLPDWEHERVDYQVSLIDVVPTILSALSLSVPDSCQGVAASSPAELHRSHVYFTATGPYRSYHGVRNEHGWKLFADRISESSGIELMGTDERDDHERVLLTTVDDGEETIRYERSLDEDGVPTESTASTRWRGLHERLSDQRGGVATRRFDAQLSAETVEQLEQLGYVDNVR